VASSSLDSRTSADLLIVMPAFNEQAAITPVVESWFAALDAVVGNFVLRVIDDGSKDRTRELLENLQPKLGHRLEILSRRNRGHGPTCLEGYREAIERQIPFILQVDSDGQCDPVYLAAFWKLRHDHDVIYGRRSREDGLVRFIASFTLRHLVRVLEGVNCVDPNVPYRLMRTTACAPAIASIPPTFDLANIALSIQLARQPGLREAAVPIRFRERLGGEPSVPLHRFAGKAVELFRQLKALRAVSR
jgi:glycosyltransferase involved in cell wall biosynthesis